MPTGANAPRGFAVRWQVLAAGVVLWNVLFLLDGATPWGEPKPPGPLVLLALGSLFAAALGVSRSMRLQSYVLQPGHSVGEIQPVLRLLQLVSGLLFLAMLLFESSL